MDTMTITKAGGAFCGALLILLMGAWAGETIYHVGDEAHGDEEHAQGYAIEVPETGGEAEVAEAEPAVPFEEVYANASAEDGESLWRQCSSCHRLEDGANSTGPYLAGVVDRDKGTAEGYDYSETLATMEGSWTPEKPVRLSGKSGRLRAGHQDVLPRHVRRRGPREPDRLPRDAVKSNNPGAVSAAGHGLSPARVGRPLEHRGSGSLPVPEIDLQEVPRMFQRIAAACAAVLVLSTPLMAQEVTVSHGYSNFGELKYGPDEPLSYVNLDAPKGGEISFDAQGNFDSFNPYTRNGNVVVGTDILYEDLMVAAADDPLRLLLLSMHDSRVSRRSRLGGDEPA